MNDLQERYNNSIIAKNLYLGVFYFSAYNLLFRYRSLSAAGKKWALFGVGFSTVAIS